ncbi:uncharacterized protein B0J16DRAFT_323340 [Fusarium flagelliforme]|uniref:uncharacterized protein n=1 Tax=Fusarium flagelliforme TaxID=2675880 RepID=UPI001E8E877E|nr:uncharacterized protein B0J16DRAFT_323340 [Fusarium flagelliforme]KAH7179867.1 hypothetical protein B0J16DRAFT_323340 [Fusarium flagelliforme]
MVVRRKFYTLLTLLLINLWNRVQYYLPVTVLSFEMNGGNQAVILQENIQRDVNGGVMEGKNRSTGSEGPRGGMEIKQAEDILGVGERRFPTKERWKMDTVFPAGDLMVLMVTFDIGLLGGLLNGLTGSLLDGLTGGLTGGLLDGLVDGLVDGLW